MVLNVGLLRSNICMKLSVAEMRMFRMISRNTMKDGIRIKEIHLKIGVALLMKS